MQNINTFINLLGQNHYLDFLVTPYSEDINYDDCYLLVKYGNRNYYELNLNLIKEKESEIIARLKSLYSNAVSDILIETASKKKKDIKTFIDLYIDAIKVKLNIIANDCYVDDKKSRYHSLLIDNFETLQIENPRNNSYYADLRKYDDMVVDYLRRIESNTVTSIGSKKQSLYDIKAHCDRLTVLSFLPFKLLLIGNNLLLDLNKIQAKYTATDNHNNKPPLPDLNIYRETHFEEFCGLIDDINMLGKYSAYDIFITLKESVKEIKSETLLELQDNEFNRNDYLEFKINEVEKRSYSKEADVKYIQKWLDEYKLNASCILNDDFQENSIMLLLGDDYKSTDKSSEDQDKAFSLQADFYFFFSKYYADELITFFKSKMTITDNPIIETDNENQLTVNQSIILLDKLGVFTDSIFESVPNTKKAKLISLLLGKNEKNVKTAIEKLELKPKDITTGYQRDLDKIQQLLDKLE